MFYVCPRCGEYAEDKVIKPEGPFVVCPFCGYRQPFRRLPLFIVSGPSGAGKTTACLELAATFSECVCMETDTLWRGEFDTPEDNYRAYRETWLRVALNIGQNGRPVALFGSGEPDQWEPCVARRYFTQLFYLALVCDDDTLARRLLARPAWRHAGTPDFIERMLRYNRTLRETASSTDPTHHPARHLPRNPHGDRRASPPLDRRPPAPEPIAES